MEEQKPKRRKLVAVEGCELRIRTTEPDEDGSVLVTATIWFENEPRIMIGAADAEFLERPGSERHTIWLEAMRAMFRDWIRKIPGLEHGETKTRKPTYRGEKK